MAFFIACFGNKWVSEIRDPRKKKRIWLGSLWTQCEAAHAFDAAMCLRNPISQLNFPDHYYKLPSGTPGHYSTRQVQAAVATASEGRSFSYHQFMSPFSASTTTTSSDSGDAQEELEDITEQQQSVSYTTNTSSCYFDEDVNLVSELNGERHAHGTAPAQ